MTDIQTINVTRKYKVTYSGGSYTDFIEAIDEITPLDSMDGGDAVGACILLHGYNAKEDGIWIYEPTDDFVITVSIEGDEPFIWDPPLSTDD